MLLALRFLPTTPIIAYATLFISSSLLYWFIWRQSPLAEDSPQGLVSILVIFFLVRVSFLGMDPLGSDDVYRYAWDGRVQTAGINPYRYAPQDEALSNLHTARLPSHVNHPEMKTIYFPLSQWIFFVGYHLTGEQVWGFQLLILLADLLSIIGLFLLMRELSYSPWRVLIYAASALAILQFSLDAHVDALGFPFLIFGLLFYQKKKLLLSLLPLGISLQFKPVALVILPILFLLPLFSDNQTTRLWCFGFLVIALSVLYLSKKPLQEKFVLAVLLSFLFSPVVHVWYVGWLIVLLPVAPKWSGLALAAAASLPSITYVMYQLQGAWKDYPLVMALEYVPVIVLLWFDLRKQRIGSSSLAGGGNFISDGH